jgi:thiol-disulfide isomerase/thioredoxin
MKRLIAIFSLLLTVTAFAQPGYEIKVTFKPYKNQYIYLGHYFGKTYPVIDSVLLNEKSEGVFKGSKKLQGGVYLIGYPNRAGFFEMLVDKQQRFSVIADTATIKKEIKFINSPDNELFYKYQLEMITRGKEVSTLQQQLKVAANKIDSTKLIDELVKLDKSVTEYRDDLIKKNPDNILTALLNTMKEPVLTERLKGPKTRADSIDAYNFYKEHYWDDVNFWDGRLSYTTFFDDKIDKYFADLVTLDPDSVITEIDKMLGPASINEEMTRFLLVKFVNRYLVQRYMWEDAVFVHLFEKYFSQKEYPWLTTQGRKTITDRAFSLMANIMGTAATDIELPDVTGNIKQLYTQAAPYTLVAFWDATCGHCKEMLPKLDSFYRAKWKAAGLKIFAVSKETDGSKKDWLDFIALKNLQDWTHVYYSKADDKARIDSKIPGYSQLYDVQTFPTLYLLDKDKRIVAKKLTYKQIDQVLELKMKGH